MSPSMGRTIPLTFMPESLRTCSWSGTALLVFVAWVFVSAQASAIGFALEHALRHRTIFNVPRFEGQLRFEFQGNVVFVAVMTVAFTIAIRTDAVLLGPAGTVRSVATFVALMLGFQVYYWFLHRAMHTRTLVRVHRWHHRSQVTTPLTGQSMSVFEAVAWAVGYVGLPIVFSRIVPLSFWGWIAYIAYNVTGNLVGHANVEPTARSAATRTATWFANAFVFHSLHHARWNGHYSFQAALMDRLMGTEWNDWPALYDRITEGHALGSLKDRGAPTHAPQHLS
jgi:sterol desaturase/sphingolipid hydroxylase (fatty acid hydroxylase superfamily)